MAFPRTIASISLALLVSFSGSASASPFDSLTPPTVTDAPQLSAQEFSAPLALSIGLFNDGNLRQASIEAKRVRVSSQTNTPAYAEARAISELAAYLRGDRNPPSPPLWQREMLSHRQRLAMAYAIGTSARSGNAIETIRLPALRYVFEHTDNASLFWNASSLLYFTLKADKRLRKGNPLLWQQLLTCRDAWPVEIVRASKVEAKTAGDAPDDAPWPLQLFIYTYRSQISPAIGSRCLLEPSCSEFYLQACRKHGWIGMGIGGDRLIREPTVTGDPERAIVMPSGLIRYTDPVSEHDYWMEEPSR